MVILVALILHDIKILNRQVPMLGGATSNFLIPMQNMKKH